MSYRTDCLHCHDDFFKNAKDILTRTGPSQIINFDEANRTDNPGANKFIFQRGTKYPKELLTQQKQLLALCMQGRQLMKCYQFTLYIRWNIFGTRGVKGDQMAQGITDREVTGLIQYVWRIGLMR